MKPKHKISFNHLSDSDFEEFCFDLLEELGFVNLNWRKGTGKKTSPSDSGRDIEGLLQRADVDGTRSTSLVNLQVLPSIFFTLKSQITPTFILPVGVKTSEFETNRK